MVAPIYYYNNFKLRICCSAIGATFIVFSGGNIDLLNAIKTPLFWIVLMLSFTAAWLMLLIIHKSTIWLDRKYDWREDPIVRTYLQILAGIAAPIAMDIVCFGSYFHFTETDSNIFYQYDVPIILLFLVISNLYYVLYYFVLTDKTVNDTAPFQEQNIEEDLTIHFAGKVVKLKPNSDIAIIYRQDKQIHIVTNAGKDYVTVQYSINSLQTMLSKRFCKINRKTIINLQIVQGYETGIKVKALSVILKAQYEHLQQKLDSELFFVSHDQIADFKECLTKINP